MDAIRIEHLTKQYGALMAVSDLCLSIPEGECFALLGVNGAGKTTTIKMLTGLTKPTSGDASLMGHSITYDTYNAKRILNISPQETAIAPQLTVRENLEMMASIYGNNKKEAALRAGHMMGTFRLTERANTKAQTLSGGLKRRLSIAMALVSQPKVLFLDEPTLGLDILSRRELWDVLMGLKGKVTIVLTTHYLEEAVALADRIGIMANGKMCAIGTADELMAAADATTFEDAFVTLATKQEVTE